MTCYTKHQKVKSSKISLSLHMLQLIMFLTNFLASFCNPISKYRYVYNFSYCYEFQFCVVYASCETHMPLCCLFAPCTRSRLIIFPKTEEKYSITKSSTEILGRLIKNYTRALRKVMEYMKL